MHLLISQKICKISLGRKRLNVMISKFSDCLSMKLNFYAEPWMTLALCIVAANKNILVWTRPMKLHFYSDDKLNSLGATYGNTFKSFLFYFILQHNKVWWYCIDFFFHVHKETVSKEILSDKTTPVGKLQ